jgi:hypothetical protein
MHRCLLCVAAMATLVSAAVAKPPALPARLYYVQDGAAACTTRKALQALPALWSATPAAHAKDYAARGCVWLASNTMVAWNGRRDPDALSLFARIAIADKPPLVMFANDLGEAPWRNPSARDFVTRAGGIACSMPYQLEPAYQAAHRNDEAWFRSTGCAHVPEGIAAVRIAPGVATSTEGAWQVRLRDRFKGVTVWMYGTALDAR